ncbi:phosphoribosyltransferase-like protein [Salinicola halophyticus]|uniref:phosphoribosyltransferase-like protein n=1 Tax=Salinicola halophyticus TaxID=1808881 RepID=UPI003F46BA88
MPGNRSFIASQTTQTWLAQFDPMSQGNVVKMLQAMRLVSRDQFSESIRTRLLQVSNNAQGRVGLYVERELPPKKYSPEPLFQQPQRKPRRAFGPGPDPIRPDINQPADVGSEGIVAQLVSELCREFPKKFVNHPGPDELRKPKEPINTLVLVTDLIGSGERAERYLDAFWAVHSVKSWWSGRIPNGLSFGIVAYGATPNGRNRVRSHRLSPAVWIVAECPTIDTTFDEEQANEIKQICMLYGSSSGKIGALGFQNTGALIAFAHGAPNNVPRMLYKYTSSWTPLFARRKTSSTRTNFEELLDPEDVQQLLEKMRHRRLSDGQDWSRARRGALETYLVLAALSHRPRNAEVVARRTGLTLLEVESLLLKAKEYGWVDHIYRLTDQGQAYLRAAKSRRRSAPADENSVKKYYPSTLRVPT